VVYCISLQSCERANWRALLSNTSMQGMGFEVACNENKRGGNDFDDVQCDYNYCLVESRGSIYVRMECTNNIQLLIILMGMQNVYGFSTLRQRYDYDMAILVTVSNHGNDTSCLQLYNLNFLC